MSFNYKINARTWEGLAQEDALWSILTDDEKAGGNWDIEAFFNAGAKEINTIFAYLEKHHYLPKQFDQALDFGCGVGRLSRFIAQRFEHTIGVDVAATMVQQASKLNADLKDKLSFQHNLEPNLDFVADDSISFIYSSIVLQHIPPQQGMLFIEGFFKKLEKGGLAVFQVPTKDIRQIGMVKKLREKLKIRQKLAVMGLVKGFQMEMNVYKVAEINQLAVKNNCSILAAPYTNHTLPAFNGNLQFLNKAACEDYESQLFIVKK